MVSDNEVNGINETAVDKMEGVNDIQLSNDVDDISSPSDLKQEDKKKR
jgi:hypothetical protein